MIAQLKKDLHDPNILDLCSDIYYYIKPETKQSNQYIEYRILKEVERNFAGNKNITDLFYVQVDIFSKVSYKLLSEKIKEVLKSKKYTIIDSVELYEEDTGYYHKALRFKYSKFKGVIQLATTVRLENGLRKLKMAPITSGGTYGDIFTVADMTNITCETSEGKQFCRARCKHLVLLLRKKILES